MFGLQLDVQLSDHDIDYVKWDMNRWRRRRRGGNALPAQTMALYRLLDASERDI